MISMRWTWVIVTMLYGINGSLLAWAEPSLPIPRTSSTSELLLKNETLYLEEETISIAEPVRTTDFGGPVKRLCGYR